MPSRSLLAAVLAALALFAASAPAQDDSWRLAMGLLQRGLHEEAAEQLRAFLNDAGRDPRVPEARYRLGVCEAECGRDEAAVAAFEAALRDRRLALRPECLYRLGGALQRLRRHADARRRYEELIEAVDDEHYLVAAAHFGAGEAARDAGDDAGAAPHFLLAAAKTTGDDPSGYRFAGLYQAGYALLRSGASDEAARTLSALAERFPQHEARGEILHLLGEAQYRGGHYEDAEIAWRAAAEAGGEYADDAWSGIGWARRQRGDAAGALEAFRELTLRHGDSPLVAAARVESARILLERGDAEQAAAELETPLAGGATPALQREALEVRGLALLEAGRSAQARDALTGALEGASEEDTMRVRHAVAECDAAEGRWEDALAGYDAVVRTKDAELRGDALYGRVLALHALGRHDESRKAAEAFLKREGGHRLAPFAAFAVAENLFALGRYEDARARYDALEDDHPLAADARAKAAWCAWLAGDAADAEALFERVAGDDGQPDDRRSEALSMAALAAWTAGRPDRALELADTYAARHPDGPDLARTERVAARVLRDRGELSAAAVRLRRAERAGPDRDTAVQVALERADVLLQGGEFEAASQAFAEHVGREDAAGARAIEGMAWCAFELGDDESCLRWIATGIAHPAGAEVAPGLRELAVTVHHSAERWAQAEQAAREFLDACPDHPRAPEVRYALGVAQARGGDPAAARATLEALAKDGGASRPDLVLYELAWACSRSGDAARARQIFVSAIELAKNRQPELADECRLRAAEIDLEAGERARARRLLAAVEHPAHVARARYLLGGIGLAEEDLPAAMQAFDAVVELGPEEPLYADALYASGETAHRAGEFGIAVERLTRLLETAPEHSRTTRARLLLGESLVREGRPAEAIGQLRAYCDAAGDETDAVRARGHLWLGRAHAAREEYEAAEAELAKAVALSQGDVAAEAQYRIGEVRRARGDLAGAADAFVRVSILYSHEEWVPKGLLEAGRTFDRLGQQDKAVRLWRELVERFGDSDEAKEVRDRIRGGER